MNELFDELERAIAIDYSKALYSCEQIVDSLSLEYTLCYIRNNGVYFNNSSLNNKLRVKFNNMLDDWFKLTNKDFLEFKKFYKILLTDHACYYLSTKSYELYVGNDEADLFIEKVSADIISTEDKINIMRNFENVLLEFKNDVIIEYKIKI
jgi:HJR/Mrr/RecB family endonuclease